MALVALGYAAVGITLGIIEYEREHKKHHADSGATYGEDSRKPDQTIGMPGIIGVIGEAPTPGIGPAIDPEDHFDEDGMHIDDTANETTPEAPERPKRPVPGDVPLILDIYDYSGFSVPFVGFPMKPLYKRTRPFKPLTVKYQLSHIPRSVRRKLDF